MLWSTIITSSNLQLFFGTQGLMLVNSSRWPQRSKFKMENILWQLAVNTVAMIESRACQQPAVRPVLGRSLWLSLTLSGSVAARDQLLPAACLGI
jgi:hypothetical protein